MSSAEIIVWSAMVGGLLTLASLALIDVLLGFRWGALRNLSFLLIAGTACTLISGLPEQLHPGLDGMLLRVIKGCLGPLTGAMALHYLGLWLGSNPEDHLTHSITRWGTISLCVACLGLGLLAVQTPAALFDEVLLASGLINTAAALLGLIVAARAAALGDPLARWMTPTCGVLILVVMGHYAHALSMPLGLGTWIATAALTVLYFLACTVLVIVRNREQRRLTRLAQLHSDVDQATGLPTGSMLLSEVEHAFWRSGRINGHSTVVCLHLSNLYELGRTAGHGVEHQILVTVAARIRRAAGFRCVVGLYHPRCFIVVMSSDKHDTYIPTVLQRLRSLIHRPLPVMGRDAKRHEFTPAVGIGIVTIKNPGSAIPLEVINEAERLAVGTDEASTRGDSKPPFMQDQIDTVW
jgi:GGDEF domain-containing protein